jgi:hypothetical protein
MRLVLRSILVQVHRHNRRDLSYKVISVNKYTLVCGFTYGRLPPDGRLTPTPTAPLNHRGLSGAVGVALPLAITWLMGIVFIGNHLNEFWVFSNG